MGFTSGLVLFAICWFMVFFVVLPLRLVTQGEDGEVVPGTPASAPADPQLKRKVKLTTIWAFVVWSIIAAVILTELITIRDLDFLDRMSPPSR